MPIVAQVFIASREVQNLFGSLEDLGMKKQANTFVLGIGGPTPNREHVIIKVLHGSGAPFRSTGNLNKLNSIKEFNSLNFSS